LLDADFGRCALGGDIVLREPLPDLSGAHSHDGVFAQAGLRRSAEDVDGDRPLLDRASFSGQRLLADKFQELLAPAAAVKDGTCEDRAKLATDLLGI
jgi:hypothetical protein